MLKMHIIWYMNFFILYANLKLYMAYLLSYIAFPQQCISCGNRSFGLMLCQRCLDELLYGYPHKHDRCSKCGIQLISEQNICLDCRSNSEETESNFSGKSFLKDIDTIFPIHHYSLWKKEILFSWKIANNRTLTHVFARLIYNVIHTHYNGLVIIPVPPRNGKIKKNGWDQVDELCKYLHSFYNVTIIKALVRVSNYEQKKRNRHERIETIEKAYAVKKQTRTLPSEVVILDDIMTTGATLESCAKALKQHGVRKIHAVTLFYV